MDLKMYWKITVVGGAVVALVFLAGIWLGSTKTLWSGLVLVIAWTLFALAGEDAAKEKTSKKADRLEHENRRLHQDVLSLRSKLEFSER